MSTQLACPKCGQIDMIQKVSVAYEQGYSSSTVPVVVPPPPNSKLPPLTRSERVVSQTEISRKLSFPFSPPPIPSRNWGCVGLIFVWLPAAMSVFFLLSALYNLVNGHWDDNVEWTLFMGLFFSPALLLIVWSEIYFRRNRKKFDEKYNVELKQYNKARDRWDRAYYCYRDDIVFIPGESGYAPADELEAFLTRIETT